MFVELPYISILRYSWNCTDILLFRIRLPIQDLPNLYIKSWIFVVFHLLNLIAVASHMHTHTWACFGTNMFAVLSCISRMQYSWYWLDAIFFIFLFPFRIHFLLFFLINISAGKSLWMDQITDRLLPRFLNDCQFLMVFQTKRYFQISKKSSSIFASLASIKRFFSGEIHKWSPYPCLSLYFNAFIFWSLN